MNKRAFYRKVARANRLIASTYKHYYSEDRVKKGHSVLDKIEQSIYMLYGKNAKGLKFYTPRNATEKELERIENAMDMVINSPYTTKAGRLRLKKQIAGTLMDKFDISKKNIDTIFDVFENENYEKVREMLDDYSEIGVDVVNDMISSGLSSEYVSAKLGEYLDSDKKLSIREWADNVLGSEGKTS